MHLIQNDFIKFSAIIILLIFILIPLGMILIPKINYRPMPIGLCEGALPENKPNWVSSLVSDTNRHYIKPLTIKSLPGLARDIKKSCSNVRITSVNESTLLAYRQSTVFNFTDWICIRADGHVTASATMGYSDFGKNRQWVTAIRNQFGKF